MVARVDQTADEKIKGELITVRRGTAYFARKLNELSDQDLTKPSLLPGWSRNHLIAHVGYNARGLARLVEWANTDVETPMYESATAREEEIQFGSTLSPIALRNLFSHSSIHLNVEWRDSRPAAWEHEVTTATGRKVPMSETVWIRTREIWIHAIDLDNGASFADIPNSVLARVLQDVTSSWDSRLDSPLLHLLLKDGQPALPERPPPLNSELVVGTLPDLVGWATGRRVRNLTSSARSIPEAPRWL